MARAMGSVVSFESSWTSRLLARWSLAYSSSSRRSKRPGLKSIARLRAGLGVAFRERRALVQPLPQDAQADFAGGHVLHEVEDVVVAEEVGGLEGRRLEALAEGVAVLEGHAQQVPGASHGTGRRLQEREARRVLLRVGEAREQPPELVLLGLPSPRRAGRCGPSSSAPPTCRWPPRAARARRPPPPASCPRPRPPAFPRGCWSPCRPARARSARSGPACSRPGARGPRSCACSRRS